MTVIAWDGKILAADKRLSTLLPRTVTKIRRTKNGSLIGCAGDLGPCMEIMAWYEFGAHPDMFPPGLRDNSKANVILEITQNGKIKLYNKSPYPIIIEDKCMAIGSGRDFAITAMYLGKNAREAVEITNELIAECGNGVDTLELNQNT